MIEGVEWALAQNENPDSSYFRKINPSQVAVGGFSCGGLQAVVVAADPRLRTIVIQNSGVFPDSSPGMEGLEVNKSMLK
jgi:dienelactone hydrolase